MSTQTKETADRQCVKQSSRQLMGPEHRGKFLSPSCSPHCSHPGTPGQPGMAGLPGAEAKEVGQPRNNCGVHAGRWQRLQVAAVTPATPPSHAARPFLRKKGLLVHKSCKD